MKTLSELKTMVDASLEAQLARVQSEARLMESMTYSLLAPGKRLRPCLLLYCAHLFGVAYEDALPYACALEMIHAYSLVHDDLPAMDDDDLRRGRPTNHVVYGEAGAILAGDGLLSSAFETMLLAAKEGALPAKNCIDAMTHIASCAGAGGMVAGQSLDTCAQKTAGDVALLWEIQEKKTACLLSAAVVGGCKLAGAPESVQKDFAAYAHHFGLAFQITDDILDVTGDEAILGKPIHSDEEGDKLTSVSLLGLDGARQAAREHIEAACAAIAAYENTKELSDLVRALETRQA